MSTLSSALQGAVAKGLVSPAHVQDLERHLAEALSLPQPSQAQGLLESPPDTEAPRFLRGFHDVLISIGILILFAGLWGLGNIFVITPAIILLSEILVARQRLALPAVVLTISTVVVTWVSGMVMLDDYVDADTSLGLAAYLAAFPAVLGLYALRYRVPLAVALFITSCLGLIMMLVFALLERLLGVEHFITGYPFTLVCILLISAGGLFAIAMRFDLADRYRASRSADIAFWLHLMTAPALLYAVLSFVVYLRTGALRITPDTWQGELALPVICVVSCLMLMGIIIDRRAFATSGLVALIVAVAGLLRDQQLTGDLIVFMALAFVGIVVLLVGVGWRFLRSRVLELVPRAMADRLPPVA
ncbi:hypothetical protein [Rhizobium sp. FKY42]|uniref:hypothetical protein n=1 Tax=Rhizobium sp. FKY42 TaxID=2562310 RepID=UPI0010BFDE6E|nr:hypothetical protein [Rhizobium sp. FKY42]